jgi:hypothetical protein
MEAEGTGDDEWPMVMVMGLPHMHPNDPRGQARMGPRRRIDLDDAAAAMGDTRRG